MGTGIPKVTNVEYCDISFPEFVDQIGQSIAKMTDRFNTCVRNTFIAWIMQRSKDTIWLLWCMSQEMLLWEPLFNFEELPWHIIGPKKLGTH